MASGDDRSALNWEWNRVIDGLTCEEAAAMCEMTKQSYSSFAVEHANSHDIDRVIDAALFIGGLDINDSNRQFAQNHLQEWIERRLCEADRTCHLCGVLSSEISKYEFGMVKLVENRWNAGRILGTFALGAVSASLFGIGVVPGLGKDKRGYVLKPVMNVCPECQSKRAGILGTVYLKETHCQKHPLWQHLKSMGFDHFVRPDKLYEWQ